MRLVGCIRVSQVRGRKGDSFISPGVQRDQIEGYAKAMGHTIVAWQEDLDQPGSTLNRPGFQAALAQIKAGDADGVIGAKLDRITRSVAHLGKLLEQARAEGWNLVAVDVGLDMSTPNGKLIANVLGSVAEWELDRRRDSWQEARARAVGRGVHVASRAPSGYRRREDGRLEPDPLTAEPITETFRLRAQGVGWRQLARRLTDLEVATPYGNTTWTENAVANLVKNRAYLGEARSGVYVNADGHEPLIDQATWDEAQRSRIRSSRGDTPLLSGLVRCAGCRYMMKSDSMRDSKGERLRMYRCRTVHAAGRCPTPSAVLARVVEPFVEDQVGAWISGSQIAADAAVATAAHEAALLEHRAAEVEMFAYLESETLAIAGRDAFEHGLSARRARVDSAHERVVAARENVTAIGGLADGDLEALWPGMSVRERARVLELVMDAVVVWPHRSGRPISDRALVVWRGQGPAVLPGRGFRLPLEGWPTDRPADVGVAGVEDLE